ncbi:acyltransferase [Micromonospora sp. WMMD882]|uniref:acyltransferase family protein n=1 Tax=Micromonospora sp. WMMD882 TaxID=3015151 RepID=UPI00248AF901|nr:acyltransferase [Micromonospora sp. WMMD882]WBB81911.1 acyltransferase [Micromonospora sp. WMMD882]
MEHGTDVVRRGRLDSITGARFVAAFVVFACHVGIYGFFAADSAVGRWLKPATQGAGLEAVSFFFILSGFVLTWSARPGEGYGRFLRRRILKMYPNHIVTFCLAMLLYAAASTSALNATLNVFLLHAWRPEPGGGNGPSWSLSVDLFFYLLFPLLLPLAKRIPGNRLWWWVAGIGVLVLALPSLAMLLPAEPKFPDSYEGTMLEGVSRYPFYALLIFPPARMLDFLLGILVARIVLTGRWINFGVPKAVLLAAASYVVGLFVPFYYTLDAINAIPMAMLIGALTVAESRGGRSWLAHPVLRRLGEASFAFYLVHEIVLISVRATMGFETQLSLGQSLLSVSVALAVSLALAFALYHWLEMPVMRKWAGSRRSAKNSAAATPAAVSTPTAASLPTPEGSGRPDERERI